jgi:hypothetical protein
MLKPSFIKICQIGKQINKETLTWTNNPKKVKAIPVTGREGP